MTLVTRHGSEVASVFDLLGRDENDLTSALGFALSSSPVLTAAILKRLGKRLGTRFSGDVEIAMEVRDKQGRTDLEVRLAEALLVFEAKRDWLLPSETQLRQYAGRVRARGALVTLSQASAALAALQLPDQVRGVPIVHLPWTDVLDDVAAARGKCRGRERFWLEELSAYLKGVIRVRDVADSRTYCVSLNHQKTGGKLDLTFVEWVTKKFTYYHPYGVSGWPTEPPNFMAFRWGGAVQRIHRVVKAEVVPTLLDRYPDLPGNDFTLRPHAIYKLSARRLPPLEPIPTGAPYRANRMWVLLDQLQTADTFAEAVERSRELIQGA
ncbi:hypothetical protein C6A85_000000113940 [Mycobacterium sp. ITM-2017-0098]|nr:hypothetical protein C6A85_000000113940 [Mycobacterium sp. ITM-2017-0098]